MIKQIALIMTTLVTACTAIPEAKVAAPEASGPTPTKNQQQWHEMEYYGLVCYGLNTYTGQEWGYGDKDPKIFKPTTLKINGLGLLKSQE